MKLTQLEFLIWFVVFTVFHFLLYCLLAFTALDTNNGPVLIVMLLCVKGLSFPLGWFLHSGETHQLSVWMRFAIDVFDSVIWGVAIASIISIIKERRSKLDGF